MTASLSPESIRSLLALDGFADDVLEGLDRGELLARRFRHVAATALMVLRNPEPGRRVRVGGLNWVSTRLYPLVKSACPDHPLLRETRREVLEDILDVPAATRWLAKRPPIRFRASAGALAVRRRLDRAGRTRDPPLRATRRRPPPLARATGPRRYTRQCPMSSNARLRRNQASHRSKAGNSLPKGLQSIAANKLP